MDRSFYCFTHIAIPLQHFGENYMVNSRGNQRDVTLREQGQKKVLLDWLVLLNIKCVQVSYPIHYIFITRLYYYDDVNPVYVADHVLHDSLCHIYFLSVNNKTVISK